jgi:hypothetical protein
MDSPSSAFGSWCLQRPSLVSRPFDGFRFGDPHLGLHHQRNMLLGGAAAPRVVSRSVLKSCAAAAAAAARPFSSSRCHRDGAASSAISQAWHSYLRGASSGVTAANVGQGGSSGQPRLRLDWGDGHSSSFPLAWLRDHAPEGYHPSTAQRQTDTVAIPKGQQLTAREVTITGV